MFNLKNIILISKNGKQYKSRVLLRSRCRCCSVILCPRSYASRSPPNSEPLFLLMMEGKSRADVATLRRRDVATSRRYCLLTIVLVDPTSRRWNVMTLQPPSYFAFYCSKLLPKFALFNSFPPAFTELAILRYRAVKIHN